MDAVDRNGTDGAGWCDWRSGLARGEGRSDALKQMLGPIPVVGIPVTQCLAWG